jgi:inosine triphosphate pyrophosphatase
MTARFPSLAPSPNDKQRDTGLNTLLAGFPTTAAHALCTFAYCPSPDATPVLFEGRTEGRIVPPRGDNQFGWDPIFEVEGTGKT